MADKDRRKRQKEEPVSLNPLDPDEALADLMKVKPEEKPERPKKKRGKFPRPASPEDREAPVPIAGQGPLHYVIVRVENSTHVNSRFIVEQWSDVPSLSKG